MGSNNVHKGILEAALVHTHGWVEEGLVLVLGVCWGIPPLRADAHGTELVHQLRRYGRDCDTLVLWGVGEGTWWAGSMSEW